MSLHGIAQQILGLIDLTALNDTDTQSSIIELCKKSSTPYGDVPAICIFRQFIPTAKKYFAEHNLAINVATVTNFPAGGTNIPQAIHDTQEAIAAGADEVDIVLPYRALIAGDSHSSAKMVKLAKASCGTKVLKVIIESGELLTPELINLASNIAIQNGADFIKTSTGKVAINATLKASEIMLNALKEANSPCGFKAAGGISSVVVAADYLALAERIMGKAWISAKNFRFGASGLLTDVLNVLNDTASSTINQQVY